MRTFRQSTNQFRVVVTSLDGINGWSIHRSLGRENDSKQSDEIQANCLILCIPFLHQST